MKVAAKQPPSIGAAITKTWANGWVTDSRVGASNCSPCRLGYDPDDPNSTDRLNHYLDCPCLGSGFKRSFSPSNFSPRNICFEGKCWLVGWLVGWLDLAKCGLRETFPDSFPVFFCFGEKLLGGKFLFSKGLAC